MNIGLSNPTSSILGTNDAKLTVQGTVGYYESGTLKTYWGLSSSNSFQVFRDASSVSQIQLHTAGDSWFAGGKLGVGTTSPNSSLNTTSFSTAYVAKTGTYTATGNDHTIECTANTFTVTLPTAVGITGRIYYIVNSGAGTITIGTTSSQTFVNVVATPTTLTMSTVGTTAVQSNGANWLRISPL